MTFPAKIRIWLKKNPKECSSESTCCKEIQGLEYHIMATYKKEMALKMTHLGKNYIAAAAAKKSFPGRAERALLMIHSPIAAEYRSFLQVWSTSSYSYTDICKKSRQQHRTASSYQHWYSLLTGWQRLRNTFPPNYSASNEQQQSWLQQYKSTGKVFSSLFLDKNLRTAETIPLTRLLKWYLWGNHLF